MTGIGASSSLPRVPAEGPFTIPFADLHQCKPIEFTTYALASRLRASWMEARVTKVARFRQGSRSPWRDAGFGRTRRRSGRLPSMGGGNIDIAYAVECRIDQLADRPDMIGHPSLHRGGV